jgi:uncharacterized protein (DUF1697 family)
VRYVALLRGINVGGKSLVRMGHLRTCAEELGLEDVSTYIASGNLLFTSPERSEAQLVRLLEPALEQRFELPLRVAVLGRARFRRVTDAVPPAWRHDDSKRVVVAFVLAGGDAHAIARDLKPKDGVDELVVTPGALIVATRSDALTRTGLNLAQHSEYRSLTIRNLRTTLKLRELLGGPA